MDFKIFATDVNQHAIDLAGAGRFSSAIEEDLGKERINRYFTSVGAFYELKKDIRRRIIFSKHNLLQDPPFIRLDLISCRNLLIYLNDETQGKVLHNFSYALNEGGYLFLGVNESNNEKNSLFEVLDGKNKLFINKGNRESRLYRPVNQVLSKQPNFPQYEQSYRQRLAPPLREDQYSDLLAERFAPPSLLINHQENVVYTTGNLDKFIKFPNRRADLNVYSMLKGSLLLVFRNGIRQLQEGKSKIIFSETIIENGEAKYIVDLIFNRVDNQRLGRNSLLLLVEFHEKGIAKVGDDQGEIVTTENYSQLEIENLEKELKLARRELHFTADELETINEELQSSNEEIQSANEELQSTNEELQSSNEELQTVNSELKSKIDSLTTLHDDMLNLYNSTQIATIFLDSGLKIRKFTPPAKKYFNIRESDIGRPISHYSYNFQYSTLEQVIQDVLENLQPLEFEIALKEGCFSIMRILPYKTESRQIKGVVLTFTDITELKQKNNKLEKISADLRASQQHLRSLVDNTPDLIARINSDLEYTFVNKALLKASKLEEKNIIGKDSRTLEILKGSEKMRPALMKEVLEQGAEREFYFKFYLATEKRCFYARIIPEFEKDDKETKTLLLICTDVTRLKEAEKEILQNNKQLSEMYERMDNFVHAIAHDLRGPIVNLKMLSNLLLTEQEEKEQKLFISEIGTVVTKLDNTLNGLIQIIEMDKENEISIKDIAFEDELNLIKSDLQIKLDKEEVIIETDFSKAPTICYIEAYLESIMKNMISNALKYRSNERTPKIRVTTEKNEDFLVLSISDNGRGIDLQRYGHNLFRPFKRFHSNTEGMGVGLYVISFMVGKNGGRIEVESEIETGTTFRIFLKPYAKHQVLK